MSSVLFVFVSFLLLSNVQSLKCGNYTDVIVAVGVGAAAVGTMAAAPLILSAAGFTSAGVAAGSLAAGLQTTAIASGSWFAIAQSVGAIGFATSTKTIVGSAAAGITYLLCDSS